MLASSAVGGGVAILSASLGLSGGGWREVSSGGGALRRSRCRPWGGGLVGASRRDELDDATSELDEATGSGSESAEDADGVWQLSRATMALCDGDGGEHSVEQPVLS